MTRKTAFSRIAAQSYSTD